MFGGVAIVCVHRVRPFCGVRMTIHHSEGGKHQAESELVNEGLLYRGLARLRQIEARGLLAEGHGVTMPGPPIDSAGCLGSWNRIQSGSRNISFLRVQSTIVV